MMKVSDITIQKLNDGKLVKDLPELYELKDAVENNAWHKNDSVFSHTVAVLEKLEEIEKAASKKANSCLDQRIGLHSRRQVIFLATLLHDISKKETLVKKEGITSCPNHGEAGSLKAMKILGRFDLSRNEKEMVAEIIKHHVELNDMLEPGNKKLGEQYKKFKSEFHDLFLEFVLLSMADLLGSQLKENSPARFDFRLNFYNKILSDF